MYNTSKMSNKETVTIEWIDVKKRFFRSATSGGLIVTLPLGHSSLDFIRNYQDFSPEKKLQGLIGCLQCPAYLKETLGEEGMAKPLYNHRFEQDGDTPAHLEIVCEATDIDCRHRESAECRKRFATPQKVEVELGA